MAKVFLLLLITLTPSLIFAQSVFINEVAWMGSAMEGIEEKNWWRYEWLELYNNADTVGMLDGWTVELYRDKLDFKIPLQGNIPPQGYFLLGASDKIPNIDLNYKNLAGKFNNSGQKVVLKNALGEVVDDMDERDGWPAGENENKRTMERTEEGCLHCEALAKQWHTSANPGGTPKAQNSSGVALKPSFNHEKLGFSSETKKDLRGTSFNSKPFFIAFPGALLAGVLALQARRFLYPEQSRRVG